MKFLVSIGVYPNKSKTIGAISVPNKYFFDFVRGVFDGDGSFYLYTDTRWKGTLMFYVSFASGSELFIKWLREKLYLLAGLRGHVTNPSVKNSVYQLRYAKREGCILLGKMYKTGDEIALARKKLKINNILGTIAVTDSIGVYG